MRKSIWTVLFTALVALVAVSCAKETDLTDVKNKIDELDQRVTALEQAVEKINKETVPGFENLVKALNEKLTVVSVVESEDGAVITFSDGTTSVITNGKDGKDGQDGKDGEDGEDGEDGKDAQAPEINITLIDGVYYWTVNGELLKDGDGNPIPVTGKGDKGDKGDQGDKGDKGDQGDPGVDGITPLFGTSSEGKVIVSYDNGENWKPLGFSVIDGSAFTSAYIDQDKSTDDYIVLVVGETEVQIPKEKNFALKIKYEGDLSSVGANAGDNIAIEYEVEGASEADEITVDVLSATAGITATISKVDALHGYILIGVPAASEAVSGKIFVFADNNKGKTNIKVISLEEGEISAVADVSAQVPATGGEIPLTVTTNKEYNVNVNDAAKSWLHVVDTKATHVDELKIVADPNTTGAYRVGVVSINDRNSGELIEEFTVVQEPSAEEPTDLASVRQLADGSAAFVKDGVVVAATKSSALLSDGTGYLYITPAAGLAVGDKVNVVGVKKTDETVGFTYLDLSSEPEVVSSGNEVLDMSLLYYGFAAQQEGKTSIHTSFVANVSKEETGISFTSFYGDKFVPVDPLDELNLESYSDGDLVVVDGYTNAGLEGVYNYILRDIKPITYTEFADWTLSWDEENMSVVNTVADETSTEWYQIIVVDKNKIGPEAEYATIEDYIADAFPYYQDDAQYYILGQYAGYPASIVISYVMDDALLQGSGSTAFNLPYGDFVAIAFGMEDETFNLTGNYTTFEFSREDPHVVAAYEDFLGTWTVNGASEWTISEKVNGESYSIAGAYDFDIDALYQDGKLVVSEYDIEGTTSSSYGTVENLVFGGGFTQGSTVYWGYKGLSKDVASVIFSIGKLKDGTFDVIGGQCPVTYTDGSTGTIPFSFYGMWGILADDAGQYAGYRLNFTHPNLPKSFAVPVEDTTVYIYKETFESNSDLVGWTQFDVDGDGNKWYTVNSSQYAHSGSYFVTSASYASSALTPDNWLFTPAIEFTEGNYLSYWVAAQDPSYPEEHYAVYISETATADVASCTKLNEETLSSGDMQKRVFAIPAEFANKTAYIAFRHFDCSDMYRMNIDDVAVSEGEPQTASASIKSISTGKSANPDASHGVSTLIKKSPRELKFSGAAPVKAAKLLVAPSNREKIERDVRRK